MLESSLQYGIEIGKLQLNHSMCTYYVIQNIRILDGIFERPKVIKCETFEIQHVFTLQNFLPLQENPVNLFLFKNRILGHKRTLHTGCLKKIVRRLIKY